MDERDLRLNQEKELLEVDKAEIAKNLKEFDAYLHPPYRWDIPEDLVKPNDPDYHHYLCRRNIMGEIILRAGNLAEKQFISQGVRERIGRIVGVVVSWRDTRERTTEKDLRLLRSFLLYLVTVLKDLKEGHEKKYRN